MESPPNMLLPQLQCDDQQTIDCSQYEQLVDACLNTWMTCQCQTGFEGFDNEDGDETSHQSLKTIFACKIPFKWRD
ncbi:hypothetical protein L596_025299 [Steinernema carpocapsae]|uniref:Uncharacterized protein n=1 Tax=Steinernema carpocapsae TaxID=34508 RepID=A0A4U5M7E1_STECR|nr:hypothetical protein L596_025299 [Steinernema carpocapsae]